MGALDLIDVADFGVDAFYHMTHRDNVANILEHGLLPHANRYARADISNHRVNIRRMRREPVYGRSIHTYVPFYFNPKNAMLYVQGEKQKDIVILAIDSDVIYQRGVLFTDGNASSRSTDFYNDLNNLNELDWDCLHDERWNTHPDGRRTRMAEVLVPDRVRPEQIHTIICSVSDTLKHMKSLTKRMNIDVKCDTNKNYFFQTHDSIMALIRG